MGILDAPVKNGVDGKDGTPGPPGPVGNTINDTLTGSVFTLSPAYATEYTLIITADTTLAVTGFTQGAAVTLTVLQDGAGSHALSLPSSWIGAADIVPNTVANEYETYVIWRSLLGHHVKRVAQGALPADVWTPAAVANQLCWYLADSLIGDDGDTVSSWGNSWTARPDLSVTGSPALHIAGGVKYVSFAAASSQYAECAPASWGGAIAQPVTIGLIARVGGTGTQPVVAGATGVLNNTINISAQGSPQHWYADAADSALATNGDWQYLTLQTDGDGTAVMRVGGSAANVAVSNGLTLNGFRIARTDSGSTYGTVDVAEVVVFGHTPGSTELANLETYLAARTDLLNGI